jgi:hypothetical protein
MTQSNLVSAADERRKGPALLFDLDGTLVDSVFSSSHIASGRTNHTGAVANPRPPGDWDTKSRWGTVKVRPSERWMAKGRNGFASRIVRNGSGFIDWLPDNGRPFYVEEVGPPVTHLA